MNTTQLIELIGAIASEAMRLMEHGIALNDALRRAHAAGSETVLAEDQAVIDRMINDERTRLVEAINVSAVPTSLR